MRVLSVSIDRGAPSMRTVQQRTSLLAPGVLCEVWIDERMQLCVVDQIGADGALAVRRLPEPPSLTAPGTRKQA